MGRRRWPMRIALRRSVSVLALLRTGWSNAKQPRARPRPDRHKWTCRPQLAACVPARYALHCTARAPFLFSPCQSPPSSLSWWVRVRLRCTAPRRLFSVSFVARRRADESLSRRLLLEKLKHMHVLLPPPRHERHKPTKSSRVRSMRRRPDHKPLALGWSWKLKLKPLARSVTHTDVGSFSDGTRRSLSLVWLDEHLFSFIFRAVRRPIEAIEQH